MLTYILNDVLTVLYIATFSEAECQRVWNTLRSSYARELNKLNSGKKKTKWQFLDVMSFLHDVMSYRKPPFAMVHIMLFLIIEYGCKAEKE